MPLAPSAHRHSAKQREFKMVATTGRQSVLPLFDLNNTL
jgi:hypothetical protein